MTDSNLRLALAMQRMLDREIPRWRLDQRWMARRLQRRALRRLARSVEADELARRRG